MGRSSSALNALPYYTVSPAYLLYTPSSFLPESLAEKLIAPQTTCTDPVTHQPGLCITPMFSVGCVFSFHLSNLNAPLPQCYRFLHRTSQGKVHLLICPRKGRATILSRLHVILLCSQASLVLPSLPGIPTNAVFSLFLWFLLS